jgi:hypothetical protein
VEIVQYKSLSDIKPVEYTFDLDGISDSNSQREFENGLSVNINPVMEDIISTNLKQYTKFYLSDLKTFKEKFPQDNSTHISTRLDTILEFDGHYLNFKSLDNDIFALSGDYVSYDRFGNSFFGNEKQMMSISLSADNKCSISYDRGDIEYNMVCNIDGCVFSADMEPTVFDYIHSVERMGIVFITMIGGEGYFVSKSSNKLVLIPLKTAGNSFLLDNELKISKRLFTENERPTNSNIIKYDDDLSVLIKKNDQQNNYLLHRTDNKISVVNLKNVINQEGTFSSTNNSVSSNTGTHISDIRRYTTINSEISRDNDNELSLNYVFGNQDYTIKPGNNIFRTPDNLYPYERININDTLFIKCGSFPYDTPSFADKIYKYDEISVTDGQHLLCTWLSGNDINSVWVDRYYYPDLISKEQALSGNPFFSQTYTDPIEYLISNNSSLSSSINKQLYFDKRSDLCFGPGETYVYERLDNTKFSSISSNPLTVCDETDNYFKDINKSGMFELSFHFKGDSSEWNLSSKRNNIEGGVFFSKMKDSIEVSFKLYDPSTRTTTSFNIRSKFRVADINFFGMSVDSLNGKGYFLLNDNVLDSFEFHKAQFVNKNILFGNLVYERSNLINLRIYPIYKSPSNMSIYSIIDGFMDIDDITISLPSGTRNSVDVIETIQNACDSASFKSNVVDIQLNGIDLQLDDLNNLIKSIEHDVRKNLSVNTEIRKIESN